MMSNNRRIEEGYSWRQGDWIFTRCGSDVPDLLNQKAIEAEQQVRASIGIKQAKPLPITQVILVHNVLRRECYLVLIHRVNGGSVALPQVENLVKLSYRRFAPYRARELRLATPAYYRKSESPNHESIDPHDGCLTKDGTPWLQQELALGTAGSYPHVSRVSLRLSSWPGEPWIYCTSIAPANDADTQRLRARFPNYGAITSIRDLEDFAMQLGIDFAISVDKFKHVKLDDPDERAYRQSSYSTSLWEGEH